MDGELVVGHATIADASVAEPSVPRLLSP
jgi:hypothetical protein